MRDFVPREEEFPMTTHTSSDSLETRAIFLPVGGSRRS
jgi:hypothetical protein